MQPIKSLIDYRNVRAARGAWLFYRVQRIVSFICRCRRHFLNSLISCHVEIPAASARIRKRRKDDSTVFKRTGIRRRELSGSFFTVLLASMRSLQ